MSRKAQAMQKKHTPPLVARRKKLTTTPFASNFFGEIPATRHQTKSSGD